MSTSSRVLATCLGLILTTTGLAAQEFELDLMFDETSLLGDFADEPALDGELVLDETRVEEVVEADPTGPDFKAALSFGASTSMGVTAGVSALTVTASDSHNLGSFGFLEWSVSLTADDVLGTAVFSAALDQLILQNSAGDISWQVGKFPIGWGEIEGTPVLDVLNAGLDLSTLGTATEDLPGQWFAATDYFGDGVTLSGFVGLVPQVSHSLTPATNGASTEFGFRASLPIAQGQVSAYAARLLPQSGVVNMTGTASSAEPFTLVGVSAHKALDAVLLEFDLAAKSGLERASASGFSGHARLDAAVGFEYAASNTTQVSGNVMAQYWLDGSGAYFDYGPSGAVAAPQTVATYQVAVTRTFAGADVDVSVFAGGALDGQTTFAAVQANWNATDRLFFNATMSQLWAQPGSLLAALNGTQSFAIEAGKYF